MNVRSLVHNASLILSAIVSLLALYFVLYSFPDTARNLSGDGSLHPTGFLLSGIAACALPFGAALFVETSKRPELNRGLLTVLLITGFSAFLIGGFSFEFQLLIRAAEIKAQGSQGQLWNFQGLFTVGYVAAVCMKLHIVALVLALEYLALTILIESPPMGEDVGEADDQTNQMRVREEAARILRDARRGRSGFFEG